MNKPKYRIKRRADGYHVVQRREFFFWCTCSKPFFYRGDAEDHVKHQVARDQQAKIKWDTRGIVATYDENGNLL